MLSKFRTYLSPGTVLGTVAVFVALGGGYAMAFVGSGQLQKGAADDIGPEAGFTTVRSLDGVGSIQGQCDDDGDDAAEVRFHNTAGESMVARTLQWSAVSFASEVVTNNNNADRVVADGTAETIDWHIFPVDANSTTGKAPQTHVQTSASNTGGSCANFDLHVLVLNTQE